jgi:hypothetical protein
MRRVCALIPLALLIAAGCSGGDGDPGNVKIAEQASAAAPKSAADLPANMPPEAKKGAEASIGQGKAIQEHMDKQAEAMRKARGN